MKKRWFILLLVLVAGVSYWLIKREHASDRPQALIPVEHFQLKNGLQVVVMPNDRVPAVTHLLVIKAGAGDDPQGKSGLAHYLEHLLFTGTKNFPEGFYDRSIARVGGTQNAYTTRDYTLYFATVDKDYLPRVMEMEADRLRNLVFDAPRAARELKVITEERHMRVDNSAESQLSERLNALTFFNHPYRQPTIGWAEDMATFTAADAKAFFSRYYRASNMVLVVAGDVSVADVKRHAQHYYGGLASGATPPRVWPKEPPMLLARHAQMRDAKVHEPRLMRQAMAPSVGAGEQANTIPLELLAHYLGGGSTSLLYEKLVREQKLATAVDVDYSALSIGPALFRISAVPAAGVSLEQLEAGLDRALADFTAGAVDVAALDRAKTLLKAEVIFAQDGLEPLAHLMSQLYAIGLDEQYFYNWTAAVDAVRAEDITAAAGVLNPQASVTGYLLPEASPVAEASHAP